MAKPPKSIPRPRQQSKPAAVPPKGTVSRGPKRKYSDAEKASALAALALNGNNVVKTARALGIPAKTLEHWKNGENQHADVAKIGDEKKQSLADRFENLIHEMLELVPGALEEASLSQLVVGIGVFTDKMQLLRGKDTARSTNAIRVVFDGDFDDTEDENAEDLE
jgi:transposase-like protein